MSLSWLGRAVLVGALMVHVCLPHTARHSVALTATLDLEGVGRAWARFARAALAATAATPAFRGPAALTAPRMPLATWVGEDPG